MNASPLHSELLGVSGNINVLWKFKILSIKNFDFFYLSSYDFMIDYNCQNYTYGLKIQGWQVQVIACYRKVYTSSFKILKGAKFSNVTPRFRRLSTFGMEDIYVLQRVVISLIHCSTGCILQAVCSVL